MKTILKLIINALAIVAFANWLPGISIDGFFSAVLVAIILSILNILVKPILVIITIPVTILTLGLFLLIINALIVKMASGIISGFEVYGWMPAILFSLLMSFINYLLEIDKSEKKG